MKVNTIPDVQNVQNVQNVQGKIHLITGDNGTGKTRYLSEISKNELKSVSQGESSYSRLICLSGTVYEKFPKPKKNNNDNIKDGYYYFGYKANNNMFQK